MGRGGNGGTSGTSAGPLPQPPHPVASVALARARLPMVRRHPCTSGPHRRHRLHESLGGGGEEPSAGLLTHNRRGTGTAGRRRRKRRRTRPPPPSRRLPGARRWRRGPSRGEPQDGPAPIVGHKAPFNMAAHSQHPRRRYGARRGARDAGTRSRARLSHKAGTRSFARYAHSRHPQWRRPPDVHTDSPMSKRQAESGPAGSRLSATRRRGLR